MTQHDNNYDNYDTLYTQPYIIHSVNVHHYCALKIILPHCITIKDLRRQLVVLIFRILMHYVNLHDLIKAFSS